MSTLVDLERVYYCRALGLTPNQVANLSASDLETLFLASQSSGLGFISSPASPAAGDVLEVVSINPLVLQWNTPGSSGFLVSFQGRTTSAAVLTKADVTGTGLAASDVSALASFQGRSTTAAVLTKADVTGTGLAASDVGAANGSPVFKSLTSPPVSGTAYTNSSGVLLTCSPSFTLAPSVSVSADVKVEISPDGITYTTWADPSLPVGASVLSGAADQVTFPVPSGWRYRVTATNGTLVSLVGIG